VETWIYRELDHACRSQSSGLGPAVCLSSYVDLWVLVLLQITKRKVKSAELIKGQLRSFILSSLTTRAEVYKSEIVRGLFY
jgi:hypothetical protein